MAADLFSSDEHASLTPLAERLRPRTFDDVIGQRHLLASGKPLAVAFASGKPHSMILWGPPGVGKTTLARLMADAFNAEFIAISAVLAGVKDIRDAVARALVALPYADDFSHSCTWRGNPFSNRARRTMAQG